VPDGLTGVMTRSELIQAVDVRGPAVRQVGVAFVDVDGLARLNYAVGHQHIDALLVELAARIVRAAKRTGIVARWGGDESVCVVPSDGDAAHVVADVAALADRVHLAVRGVLFRLAGSVETADTWSGGVLNELVRIGAGTECAIRARHDFDRDM
jgi:diguanylate cyclase (GGDEF)-like protein